MCHSQFLFCFLHNFRKCFRADFDGTIFAGDDSHADFVATIVCNCSFDLEETIFVPIFCYV